MGVKRLLPLLLCAAPVFAEPSLKADLMFVGAHPDDDSMATATMGRYALEQGANIAVISATRGEGGGNQSGREYGAALGIVREAEQRAALAKLGIRLVYYLDREDFGFTTSAEAAQRDWGHDAPLERLVRYVRTLQPDVILTMHPVAGHGHHQFAARLATEAFFGAADPKVFPEQLAREALAVWQPRKLYYAAEGWPPDVKVDATPRLAREREALREYRSQGWALQVPEQSASEDFVRGIDLVGGELLFRPPVGVRVVPSRPWAVPGQPLEVELQEFSWATFAGPAPELSAPAGWRVERRSRNEFTVIPNQTPGALVGRWGPAWSESTVQLTGPVRAQLEPIAPLLRFQEWASKLGLQRLTPLIPPSYAVPQGGSVEVGLVVENLSRSPQRVRSIALSPGERRILRYPMQAPQELGEHPFRLFEQNGTLAVVPRATLPIRDAVVDRLWEGKTSGPNDLSARFSMRVAGDRLFVEVDVQDDVVVSDIAEDDNRAHWRTDSVELAFDPAGPGASPHTLDTYKVGIIPFNRKGKPMAARDADAKPGPVQLPLRSLRTPGGYRLETSLSLPELGLPAGQGFGFNLMVYDADTVPSEARIAWSAWEAVQGTPRLWGHVR